MPKRETSSAIDEAAADWALRIDEAVLTGEEQAEFDGWLQDDIRRAGAFARAKAVLLHVKRAKALGSEFEPGAFHRNRDETENVAFLADEPAEATGLTRRRILLGASAVAATAVAALVLPARTAAARTFETGRGETRLVPLEDGSTVTLNTDSRIAVTLDGTRRTVELVRGEALFKVAADGRARFLVEAGDTSLRTDHAVFSVCRIGERPLHVKICEGDVEIARDRRTRLLRANSQATVPPTGAMIERRVTPEALQRSLAWQEGMLAFEDTPLSEAAAEFARYSDRRIRIPDLSVGAETVTGLYAANDPEGFARAVALGLDLHMQKAPGGIILTR